MALRYFPPLLFSRRGGRVGEERRQNPGGGVKTSRKFVPAVRRVERASGNKRVAPNPTYLFTAMEADYTKLHENASNPTDTRGRARDRTARRVEEARKRKR